MAASPNVGTGPSGEHLAPHPHRSAERDTFAHTAPLLLIWLPMLLVVGLVILAGATTSHLALAGAIVGLLLTTFAVVNGTVHLANLPPEDDEEDDREQGQAPPPAR